jgi:hypothetical protein
MPIKEEPVVINFKYESGEDDNNCVYNVQFNTDKGTSLITIELEGGDVFNLPIDLLIETVDFLRKKGAIQNSTCQNNQINQTIHRTNSLPLPQVVKQKKDSTNFQSTIEPVSSFAPSPVIDIIKQAENKAIEIASQPQVIVEDLPVEVFKRPVIRSRIRDDDNPKGAEEEAALLRGSSGKTIKRANE